MINSGIHQPPIRDFMDDLTVTTTTQIYKQDGSFQRWKIAFLWRVWIKFKRKMSCIKGHVNRLVKMQIQGKEIPSTVWNLINICFGKWFNESLTDKDSIEYTTKMVQTWLKIVDDSGHGLPEKHMHKAWIYQQGIPSRLMWLLYIYIWSCNYYSWIWLGVPPSFTSTGLYGNSTQLRILTDGRVQGCETPSSNDFMRLDRRQGCENRDSSKDRKKLLSKNISRQSNKEYASLTRHHWKHKHWTTGHGNVTFQQWFKASTAERCTMDQAEVRLTEEGKAI